MVGLSFFGRVTTLQTKSTYKSGKHRTERDYCVMSENERVDLSESAERERKERGLNLCGVLRCTVVVFKCRPRVSVRVCDESLIIRFALAI